MTEEQEKFMEENVFPIISLAGESKSLAYEALKLLLISSEAFSFFVFEGNHKYDVFYSIYDLLS